jgi:expansin (peptidoglycan-binding protein)
VTERGTGVHRQPEDAEIHPARTLRYWAGPLIAAAALVCALTVITGIALRYSGTACAAVPDPRTATKGTATLITADAPECDFAALPADGLYVGLSPTEYDTAAACGSYLDVSGPAGSARVKVVTLCASCSTGQLTISPIALTRIGGVAQSTLPVSYRRVVNPPVPGPLTVQVRPGGSATFIGLVLDNHGNPLTSVEISSPTKPWTLMRHANSNHWKEGNFGAGPFTIRIVDVEGRRATVPGITLSPGLVQQTGVQLGGGTVPPVEPRAPVASGGPAGPGAPAARSTARGSAPADTVRRPGAPAVETIAPEESGPPVGTAGGSPAANVIGPDTC